MMNFAILNSGITKMRIGLQNFQSIGKYVEIDLAPITLFFGPNSAGKSTIADALQQLRQIFSPTPNDWPDDLIRHYRRPQPLPNTTSPQDSNHHLILSLATTFQFADLPLDQMKYYDDVIWSDLYKKEWDPIIDWNYPELPLNIQIHMDHSGNPSSPSLYLDSYQIFLEDTPFLILSDKFWFNRNHPRFQEILAIWRKSRQEGYDAISDARVAPKQKGIQFAMSLLPNQLNSNGIRPDWFPLGFINKDERVFFSHDYKLDFNNFYAHHWRELFDDDFDWFEIWHPDFQYFRTFLDLLIRAFNHSIRMALSEHHFIAPIRNIPPMPLFVPSKLETYDLHHHDYVSESHWSLLALAIRKQLENTPYTDHTQYDNWAQSLSQDDQERLRFFQNPIDFVNHMLSGRDLLNTPYTLQGRMVYCEIAPEALKQYTHSDEEKRAELRTGWAAQVHIVLHDRHTSSVVAIEDVGTGISQVIPVLAAAWMSLSWGVSHHIQQPELHLHPKLQAVLGDVFIICANLRPTPGMFLLETHSEHFLLRILRRIRDTHHRVKLDIDPKLSLAFQRGLEITNDKVSVVYVQKDSNGQTQLRNLRVAEDGEFLDRWPGGFFTERDDELFSDLELLSGSGGSNER